MQTTNDSASRSLSNPGNVLSIPSMGLEKLYIADRNNHHERHKTSFFISFDDNTITKFIGQAGKSTFADLAEHSLYFVFSDSISGDDPNILVFGVKEGQVVDCSGRSQEGTSEELQLDLDDFGRHLLIRLFLELRHEIKLLNVQNIASFAHSFILHLAHLRKLRDYQNTFRGLTPRQVKKVISFMQEYLSESIALAEIADQLKISQGYLCTRFRQSTGLTPFAYLNKLRMEKAMDLLQDTSMLIIQVGMQVGIDNPAQFCRAFKKFYGQSPSKVRKQIDS